MPERNRFLRRWWKPGLKLLVVGLLVWFVRGTLTKAWEEIQAGQVTLEWPWMLAAGAAYLVGQIPSGWFWLQVLHAMEQPVRAYPAYRAYFIGHLGKYVPGKALVVILRAALVKPFGADAAVAAISVFVETLTMMAVGAALAAVVIAIAYHENWKLLLVSVGLFAVAGAPALPPIFRRVLQALKIARAYPQAVSRLQHLRAGVLVPGWIAMTIGWILQGISLWATLRAMGLHSLEFGPTLPLLTATVALAIVAGFATLIPGGIVVREIILTELLTQVPGVTEGTAFLSATVLRLITIVAELGISGILYVARPVSGITPVLTHHPADAVDPSA